MALSIMTLSLMAFSIKTLGIIVSISEMTFGITDVMTLSIMTLGIIVSF